MFMRRRVRFMAKSQLFSGPLQWILYHGGVFPVRPRPPPTRTRSSPAETILDNGRTIVMYCEGGALAHG